MLDVRNICFINLTKTHDIFYSLLLKDYSADQKPQSSSQADLQSEVSYYLLVPVQSMMQYQCLPSSIYTENMA
jgi:hypothetical protein